MKRDCNNCPIRSLFDSVFKIIRTETDDDDITCTVHGCGCLEYSLYDDTPGFREKDKWINNKKCLLDDSSSSYELPQYKGTYEDLLKAR